jgi:hypothetical protein
VNPAPEDLHTTRRNSRRRAIGITVCLLPILLMVASIVVGLFWPRTSPVGVVLALFAVPLVFLNLYLAAARPSLYRRRHGSMEGYRNVSGVPLIGNLLAVIGCVVGFCDWRAATVGLFALVCDVGGLPWFIVATWRDPSFWDE